MANEDLVIWEPNEREQEWLDNHQEIRSYEVSIWTLQDDFITVLKYANVENKGQIQDGKAKFNVDGTQELTFTIPMYLYNYQTNILEENPIWYNTRNGNIAIDMRKIKLIFNKESDDEKVYEFLITKINERHSNDQLFCDVSCEGLAFHELGKIGYKVSLTPDDFYNDDYDWFKEERWTDSNGNVHNEQPIANLQYWLNKFLSTSYSSPNEWYYTIEMNYGAYVNGNSRSTSVVYEEPYASSWSVNGNGDLTVLREEQYAEKERLVELEESNIYNLTQNLAETFEVFCRYEYSHDKNYHITGRKIIFYNNFIYENEKYGYIDFTYPYSTAEITREMDSTDLVTKMFVQAVEDETTASGLLTIINTEANKSGEDYLLNFDYLHDIKAISEEQYAEVARYEAQMKQLNLEIAPIESQIVALSAQLPTLEAKLKIASNAIQLDTERIGAASDLFNALTEGDGEIEITPMNPATAIMLQDQGDEVNKSYYINLSKHGIDSKSIRIFRYFDVQKDEKHLYDTLNNQDIGADTEHDGRLYVELKTGRLEYDEFGDVIKVRNLYLSKFNDERKTVFLTYNYTPKLYYDRVVKTWTNRLVKDTADKEKYEAEIERVTAALELAKQQYELKLKQKAEKIKKFEQAMGPALREGYWNPDDYKDCGDKYTDEITLTNNVTSQSYDHRKSTNSGAGQKELLNYFIWDSELFNNEFDAVYTSDTEGTKKKYPCINLSNFSSVFSADSSLTMEELKNRIDNLSFFFCDYNGYTNEGSTVPEPANMRAFAVGSQCQYGFVKRGSSIIPVLILNGMETIPESITISKVRTEEDEEGNIREIGMDTRTEDMMTFITSHAMKFGALKVNTSGELDFENWSVNVSSSDWITDYDCTVYPRMVITSLAVKTSSDQLFVTYAKKEIKNVEDYYCLTKIPEGASEANFYITLKPQTVFRLGGTTFLQEGQHKAIFGTKYTISNADTSIYLDAKKILKENAYPKVSYTIKLSTLNRKFMHNAYDRLCYIAHINDAELKFQNTMGYISQVDLNLDKPWEDEVEVKNYKTKFEDLFSTILASTEEMKKSGYALRAAASAFDAYGSIKPWALEGTIYKVDLDYAFNQGTLTITEKDGIWGVSESGVVAIRGGGIFTSTEQDGNGNWKWNTGITPEGINATLITAGQLDTNRVMVYAGDKLRFQLNGEGLFAYKSFFEDLDTINDWIMHPSDYSTLLQATHEKRMKDINEMLAQDENSDLDAAQYVKMDANGLFLIAKEGALVLNSDKTDYIRIGEMLFEWVDTRNQLVETFIPKDGVERASITWDGFSLKNYYNQKVLYADADTGNLSIKGTIYASELNVGGEDDETSLSLNQYLDIPDKLIIEGLTVTNIAKLKNGATTIFYMAENELINYLDDGLYAINPDLNKKQGTDGDIWYNIRSPKKELTVFKITDISSSPRTRKNKKGEDLPHTEYDYWKMQQLEDKNSDFKFAKALIGIYQSNVDGTKYNTIYKCDCEATNRDVEVVIEPETFTIIFIDKETGEEIQREDLSSSTAKDIEATLHNKAAKIEKELEAIPLEDQVPNLAAINANSSDLKFGDIWINPNAKDNNGNSIIAIYRWDADYENEEELLTEEYESLIDKVEKDDAKANTNNAATLVDDTPGSSSSSSSENLTSGKWVLLNNVSAIAMEDKVLYDLLKAEGKVGRIAHGEYGLIFTDSKRITDIQLNKKVGLQIKSRDGAYFRVNSSQFGFVSADGKTPYLYYEDGNLYIMGTIFARRFYVLESSNANATRYTFDEYLGYHFEDHVNVSENLGIIFNKAGDILNKAWWSLSDLANYNLTNATILADFLNKAKDMPHNPIELVTGDGNNTVAALRLHPTEGIWMGSTNEIAFYSGTIPNAGTNGATEGASVIINKDRVMLGVASVNSNNTTINSGSAVDIKKDYIVLATGANIDILRGTQDSNLDPYNTLKTTGSLAGVVIEKNAIGMAIGNNNATGSDKRNLILMDSGGITLGNASAVTTASVNHASGTDYAGSFVKISEDGIRVGSTGHLYIRSQNVFLDTAVDMTAGKTGTGFGLGQMSTPEEWSAWNSTAYDKWGLVFDGENLHIKGNIYANGIIMHDGINDAGVSFYEYFAALFNTAADIVGDIQDAAISLGQETDKNYQLFNEFQTKIRTRLQIKVYNGARIATDGEGWDFKPGDQWIIPGDGTYLAMASWSEIYNNASTAKSSSALSSKQGWAKINNNDTLAEVSGTYMYQDAELGIISMWGSKGIHLFTGTRGTATGLDDAGEVITNNAALDLTENGIYLAATKEIELGVAAGSFTKSNDEVTVDATFSGIRISDEDGIWMGSSKGIRLFATGTTKATMKIDPTEFLFGVVGSTATSVVNILQDKIIMGSITETQLGALKNQNITISSTPDANGDYSVINEASVAGLRITPSSIGLVASANSIVLLDGEGIGIGSKNSNNKFSGILVRPSALVMTTDGTVRLYGSVGEIVFGSKDAPKFKVTPDGDVYCKRIYAEEGFSNGVSSSASSDALWTASWTSTYGSSYSIDNHSGSFASGVTKLPGVAKYTVVLTLSGGGSAYFQRANVRLRSNGGSL